MVEHMVVMEFEACAKELARAANPTPAVTSATRALWRFRAEQLTEIHAVVESGAYFVDGYRSPTARLADVTREGFGQCKGTLRLAERIVHMPLVQASFGNGTLSETALRLLTDSWAAHIADVFERDEAMLLRWATSLPAADLRLLLDTWRMHADPDDEAATAADQFDARSLHLSKMLDGVGQLDGTLDPEGYALVHEAIRALSQRGEDETRTAAQRRADALVQMAKMAIESFEPIPGQKRRKPTVIATSADDDLCEATGGGGLDTGGSRSIVPISTVRRMACDCEIHRYISDPVGHIIDFGRKRRIVSDVQFDLLMIRDHRCRWPGCGVPAAGCDAHHATHWLDGGETKPDNLILLCWYHHHLLHDQHWSIEPLGAGYFTLQMPDGRRRDLRPPLIGAAMPAPPSG
jgi:hypothetical protein